MPAVPFLLGPDIEDPGRWRVEVTAHPRSVDEEIGTRADRQRTGAGRGRGGFNRPFFLLPQRNSAVEPRDLVAVADRDQCAADPARGHRRIAVQDDVAAIEDTGL